MRQRTREAISAYLYLVPNFCGFLLFTSLPVAFSLVLSFCTWDLLTWPPKFVGFGNFVKLVGFSRVEGVAVSAATWHMVGFFALVACLVTAVVAFFKLWNKTDSAARYAYRLGTLLVLAVIIWAVVRVASVNFTKYWKPNDFEFWKYFYNTLFLMVGIPIGMFLSLMLALVMNQKLKGIVVFRTIFFLPNFTAGIAICLLWKWLYNTDYGLVNGLVQNVTGFLDMIYNLLLGWAVPLDLRWAGPDWLGTTTWAKPAFILMGLWSGAGGINMILYLAALQNINPELYEAAEIDGAGRVQMFRCITWPLISPTTFFITIMSVIGGFQGGFQAAFVMTQGGPEGSTTTMSYFIYKNAFEFYRMGYAATIAWVLFVCVFSVTLLNWRFGGKLVHYE